jgi:ABC-type phosphate/phosphonate transport system ATPase subunit
MVSRKVVFAPGLELQVSPLSIAHEENCKLISAFGAVMAGKSTLMEHVDLISKCTRRSLLVNHTPEEVDKAMEQLAFAEDLQSPMGQCLVAMLSLKLKDEKAQ